MGQKEKTIKFDISEQMSEQIVYANKFFVEALDDVAIIYFGFDPPSRITCDSIAIAISFSDLRLMKDNWAQYVDKSPSPPNSLPLWRPISTRDVIPVSMLLFSRTNGMADTTGTVISLRDVAEAINNKKVSDATLKSRSAITIRTRDSLQHQLIVELLDKCILTT